MGFHFQPRLEHEGTLVCPRVWKGEVVGVVVFLGSVVNAGDEVNIEGSGTPMNLARAVGVAFEFVRVVENIPGCFHSFDDSDGVHEVVLLDAAPGWCRIQRGRGDDAVIRAGLKPVHGTFDPLAWGDPVGGDIGAEGKHHVA